MENWKDQKSFKWFEIFDFFLSSWIFCLDFTYIQPICLCVKNYFNSLNPNNTQINYFLRTIAPLNFDCFSLKNSVSKFNILEKIIFENSTSLIYFPLKWSFSNVPLFSSFWIGFYYRTKTQKLLKFLNLWKI